jgi:hypothetical protein
MVTSLEDHIGSASDLNRADPKEVRKGQAYEFMEKKYFRIELYHFYPIRYALIG